MVPKMRLRGCQKILQWKIVIRKKSYQGRIVGFRSINERNPYTRWIQNGYEIHLTK